jgi:hypothetical protein
MRREEQGGHYLSQKGIRPESRGGELVTNDAENRPTFVYRCQSASRVTRGQPSDYVIRVISLSIPVITYFGTT